MKLTCPHQFLLVEKGGETRIVGGDDTVFYVADKQVAEMLKVRFGAVEIDSGKDKRPPEELKPPEDPPKA